MDARTDDPAAAGSCARATPPGTEPPHRSRRILDLIAAFKFVKAAALVAAAGAALGLLSDRVQDWATVWLEQLSLGHGQRLLASLADRAIPFVDNPAPHSLVLFAIGALLYAGVFVVEGVGLIRERRWAEYLTIGVTVSFLPFEVVALAHRMSMPRIATLVMNVLVVAYLAWRLRVTRPGHP